MPDGQLTDFDALFRDELAYVLRTLVRLGVRERDAPDVAQELWVAVHRHWSERDPARPARPWLFAFACRSAQNYRRLARHRELPTEESAAPGASSDDPERSVLVTQRRSLLLRAIDALDMDHRIAVVLVDIDEVPGPEAAVVLGVPLNTVYSRVRHGRIKLREALAALRETVPPEEEP